MLELPTTHSRRPGVQACELKVVRRYAWSIAGARLDTLALDNILNEYNHKLFVAKKDYVNLEKELGR